MYKNWILLCVKWSDIKTRRGLHFVSCMLFLLFIILFCSVFFRILHFKSKLTWHTLPRQTSHNLLWFFSSFHFAVSPYNNAAIYKNEWQTRSGLMSTLKVCLHCQTILLTLKIKRLWVPKVWECMFFLYLDIATSNHGKKQQKETQTQKSSNIVH